MILTVTPNPAIDMTYHVDSFTEGETLRVGTALARAGGKGINVARVATFVGESAHVLASAGGDTGRELAADLVACGIAHTLVSVAGTTRRSVAIVDSGSKQTTIMNERGVKLAPEEARSLQEAATTLLVGVDCVVGSGSLAPGIPETFYADLVTSASLQGIPTIIDAVGPALLHAAKAGATILKPNRDELRQSTGTNNPLAGAAELIKLGAGMVLVSLGAEGMLAMSASAPNRPCGARLPQPLEGNPTGAGDAAVAAAAVSIARGEPEYETILSRATAWSAAAVVKPAAGEIADNYAEFEQLLTLFVPQY